MKFRKLYLSRVFFCSVLLFGLVGCGGGGSDSGSGGDNNSDISENISEDYQGNWKGKASKIGDDPGSFGAVALPSVIISATEIEFEITGNNIEGKWVMWSGAVGICNPLDPSYWSNPACTNPLKPVLWANFEGTCTFSDNDEMSCKVDNEEWNDSTDITGSLNYDSTLSVEFFSPGQSKPFITADSLEKEDK